MTRIIGLLVYFIGRAMSYTYRIQHLGPHCGKVSSLSLTTPNIIAFWHQNLMATLMAKNGVPYTVPISTSKDGDYVSLLAKKMGQKPVRGSSRRGNNRVLLEMLRGLKNGQSVGITVDGPIGPKHQAKQGVIELSRRTQTPIYPITSVGARYCSISKSWDQFRIPIPFTTIYVFHGKPIQIQPSLQKEDYPRALKQLEQNLIDGEKLIQEYIRQHSTWNENMNLSKIFKLSTLLFLFLLASCKAPAPKTLGLQSKGQIGQESFSFSPCPDKPNCYSSFSPEDGDHYFAPISSKFPKEENLKRIKKAIEAMKGAIITEKDSYIHATFTSSVFKFVDDVEVFFKEDGKIFLKSASRTGRYDFGVNLKRLRELEFKFNQNSI